MINDEFLLAHYSVTPAVFDTAMDVQPAGINLTGDPVCCE